jgi:hypothetical protein
MDLSSFNADVLLHLTKFVDPVDRFNLVVSGILKGFENVNEGLDLRQRYCEHLLLVQCKWCNHNIIYPELKKLELNWGNVVMAHASWKSR